MASSSSPSTWRYDVFVHICKSDVRPDFIRLLNKQLSSTRITGVDHEITIRESIYTKQRIWESKISIVVLSKYFGTHYGLLEELLEILKCEKDKGQIVVPIFFEVDPFDVRKQTGDFGIAFEKMWAGKTDDETRKWRQALDYVGNLPGERFLNWDNGMDLIEKIAKDVSNKLNAASSTNNPIEESKCHGEVDQFG